MRLTLFDTENKYSAGFIEFLKYYIIKKFLSDLTVDKLVRAEVYINTVSEYKSIFKKYISAKECAIAGIYNTVVRKTGIEYVFEIDINQIIPGTSAKLYEICKLINYGNLVLTGYPIFTNTYKYIEENIDDLYDLYVNEGGI